MKNKIRIDNRGLNWRQVKDEIGKVSDQLHVGYDTLYAYLFQASLAFIQTRVVAGCRVVIIVAQFSELGEEKAILSRLVQGWMIIYGATQSTVTLYNYIGDTVSAASDYFDKLVATIESEVKDEKQ